MDKLTRITVINELKEKIKNEKTKIKTCSVSIAMLKQDATVSKEEIVVSEQIITNSGVLLIFYENTLDTLIRG